MGNMMNTPSLITSNYALSYGFYDSGPGWGSLTNQDQSYVYVTTPVSRWMTDLINDNPALRNAPLSVFALPGAHDSGMFSTMMYGAMEKSAAFLNLLGMVIGIANIASFSISAINRAIINLSVTQKDNITTMLNLGVRYFDFRPGYTWEKIASGIYHEHNFIPGYDYPSFLDNVLTWLANNPSEFVVVNLNFQGFAQDSMKPSVNTLMNEITNAQKRTKTENIKTGDPSSLNQKISDLLASNTRMILITQIGSSTTDAKKYDSYSDAYQTTNPQVIINALNGMKSTPQDGAVYTVLQLQGTANGTGGGIFTSIATMSDASSPLMSTKAMFDHSTYPWLQTNVAKKFSPNYLVIFLNDFADNTLASIAKDITAQRLAALPATSQWSNLRKVAAVGGPGSSFDDVPATVQDIKPITKVSIHSGNIIDQLDVFYAGVSKPHGGNGGGESSFSLSDGEYITEVSGDYGEWYGAVQILMLKFKTSKGKTFGPYGNMDNSVTRTPFSFKTSGNEAIVGFYGTVFTHTDGLTGLSAIGVGIATHQ
jgi:hypothetical protein